MRAIMVALMLVALTAGCTMTYTHTRKGQADFDRDKADCQKVAAREAARNGTRTCDEVDRCLVTTKGWQRSGTRLF
jgi:uncharacterized protein YceK